VPIDKRADVGFELPDGGMNTSPEPLSGELREPALDLIDPRRRSRREADVIVRPPGEPRPDLGSAAHITRIITDTTAMRAERQRRRVN